MIKHPVIPSILITIVLLSILTLLSTVAFGEYGFFLFMFVPLLIGFLPTYLVSRTEKVSLGKANKIGMLTLVLFCFCLLIFAMEGLICIAMAFPIALLISFLGSYIAYKIQGDDNVNSSSTALMVFMIAGLGSLSFDYVDVPKELIPIRTKIIVNANIQKVWENVVTFPQIAEPTDWIFKTGLSYPTNATIKGTGVGAIRYCNFTTGSFVEPITIWEEPTLLAFDVKEQPIPMNELNPFWEVHPPHLDGYFKSYKGQFRLTSTGENKTELEGTTWYQVDIAPGFYWQLWSDFIIHRIHERVLNHICNEAEFNS